jgi:hypothetical protein
MIEKIDMNFHDYAAPRDIRAAVINLTCKINEIIDYLNAPTVIKTDAEMFIPDLKPGQVIKVPVSSLPTDFPKQDYKFPSEQLIEVLHWKYSRAVLTTKDTILVQYSDAHPESVICFAWQNEYKPSEFHSIRKDMKEQSDIQSISEEVERLINPLCKVPNYKESNQEREEYNKLKEYLEEDEKKVVKETKELIEEVNKPKWKPGDTYWYLDTHNDIIYWYPKESNTIEQGFYLDQFNKGKFLNSFKTKELAKQALTEIKQVLEKYQ